jgi:flavin reductase (DIM6/NTAB) family NADH-FMN oxidoreductase RutF
VFDPANFRRGCAKFATGITVVTVIDRAGAPHGLTVNSFTSVSLAPPLVLVAIDHASNVLPIFRAASHYGISVLSSDQQALSVRFARKGQDRFDGVAWRAGETGVPLIPDALAHFECLVRNVVEAGDHAVFVGEVERVEYREGKPLLYFDSSYRVLE